MKIIVDKLPDTCNSCWYFKSKACFLTESSSDEQSYMRLDNCPLIELNDNVKINTEEVDNYGAWERRYKMYLSDELISEWTEHIYGRRSSWND